MPRSLRTVKSATQSPPPAESPATTIFSGCMALCGAFGGGFVKYKSGIFLVSVSRESSDFAWSLHAATTSCLESTFISMWSRRVMKIDKLTTDTARDTVELYGS